MAAGSIIIDLLMRTGAFQTDTDRAAKALAKFEKQAIQTGKVIGTALGVGAVAAAALFDSLAKGAGSFKDLEETTGASAENIASFAVSAAGAGVEVSSVADSMNKLTKNLVGVDDESKAAGAALKALGLNVDAFKQLDPAAQYEAVGKALSGYADGAGKVAVAQSLFGKSGAEQLKVFKDLEAQGGRQIILTQRQIELADAYGDAQATATSKLKLYAQAAATEALPALTDLTKAFTEVLQGLLGVDKAGKQISANNAVKEFANDAADAIAFMADAGLAAVRVVNAIAGSFKSVGADILFVGKAAQFVKLPTASSLEELKAAFDQRNRIAEESNQKYIDILNKPADAFRAALSGARGARTTEDALRRQEDRGFTPNTKPQLDFEGAQKALNVQKEVTSEAQKYLERLQDQLQATLELTNAEKLLADIRSGKLKVDTFSPEFVSLKLAADEIDAAKELNRVVQERAAFRKADYEAANDAARANEEADRSRVKSLLAGTEKAVFDRRQSDLVVLQNELAAGRIEADQYADAVKNLFNIADEGAQSTKRAVDELNMSFQSAFEDAIVEGKRFGDVLKGLEKDLIRIALRKLVIEPAANSITSGLASFFGGSSASPSGDFVGPPELAKGMDYVPYDGFIASLHKGERVVPASEASAQRRNAGGGGNVYITNNGGGQVRATRDGDDWRIMIDAAVAEVDRRIDRGGSTAKVLQRRGVSLSGNLPNRTR